jgi:mono/diheme cytochrome c family protein
MPVKRLAALIALLLLLAVAAYAGLLDFLKGKDNKVAAPDYPRDIQPLFAKYCYDCHGEKAKADLDLRLFKSDADAVRERKLFQNILKQVQTQEMPPAGKPKPTEAEREKMIQWIESVVFQCDCNNPDPGRVTLRRLNRVEYNNTIRDLLGVQVRPADDFPADDIGYGFDNIGDVLFLSPTLMEKYLAAAERVLEAAWPHSPSHSNAPPTWFQRRYVLPALQAPDSLAGTRETLRQFARRAYRRPVTETEVERLVLLLKRNQEAGDSLAESLRSAFKAILVSPHFLFRGEPPASAPAGSLRAVPLNEHALAVRLSYFLWSSMPDDSLFAEAERGTLRKNLEAQVRRMLQDPKADALVANFAEQWLELRRLAQITPDPATFPEFSEDLRAAMLMETSSFFRAILREDRSVLEFLDADYTFANETLAKHYGLKGVTGPEFRKVSLKGTPRGGLLTQASILTLTSNPTRTSPVKRGKWVLDNLLGAPPPPPPPNVPELPEHGELHGTLRQRLEQHRADPLCSSCHARMDPIGFGLENFNAIGGWRTRDGQDPLDTTGQLTSGEAFKNSVELRAILRKKKKEDFLRCLSEKMLTYALGRGMEYYDRCALDKITANLPRRGHKFSALVLEIVQSVPFQNQRGEAALAQQE